MTDHRSPKIHRDPPTRPPHLIDDGFLDEPEPRLPIHPPTEPRRSGCNWGCLFVLAGCAVFWVVVALVAATVVR